jgi:uridine kinase
VPYPRPYLIGIAGPSGAGKSTLAAALAEALGAPIISLDSYYRELAHLPLEERARMNFDEPRALDAGLLAGQLTQLAAGEETSIPIYDFSRHTRAAGATLLRPRDFILVEGLFALYWPEVRALLGTKVFAAAPDDLCFTRRLERDVRERGRTPASVTFQYSATVRPMAEKYILPTRSWADVVVSGAEPLEHSVAAVRAHIARYRATSA